MEGIPLKRRRSEFVDVDIKKCIICQIETNDSESTCSNAGGRMKVIEAARIRNDLVARRLEQVDHEQFVYHVNNRCYKSYTLKKTLNKLEDQPSKEVEEVEGIELVPNSSVKRSTRARIAPRAPPSTDIPASEKKCTLCGNIKLKGDRQKFRICEDVRAEKFLRAVVFFQDDVYYRTSDLQDVHSVFGSDLYCHKNCIRNYLIRYDRAVNHCDAPSNSLEKNKCFARLLENIDFALKGGQGFALSDLRDSVNGFTNSQETFSNRDIRLFLESHYGQDLNISRPTEANKCDMVFLNASSSEMADVIRSSNPITQSASAIRHALLNYNFELEDKFCDSADLQDSWNNMNIPDELFTFLCVLLNYNRKDLECSVGSNINNDDSSDEETCGYGSVQVDSSKLRKLKSVFQVMYFMVHNGRRRTPLHLMNAEGIHATCKSKTLITSLNHLGLSVSYDEILRYQNDLAELVCTSRTDDVPLPSHLNPEKFTTAAFDNFDHQEATLSGLGGTHDTVSVLYQEKSDSVQRKPQISETSVIHGPKSFQKTLKCQELKNYFKPTKKGDIPSDYSVNTSTLSGKSNTEGKDLAWSLARMNLSNIEEGSIKQDCDVQLMPCWSAFNSVVTDEKLPENIVGFLPILPFPVTQYNTVYTALKNFQNVLQQLHQNHLAIACDEGVYRIAREIMLWCQEEFKDLTLCLGSFHLIKIYLGCIGKYLHGSGAESIWIENEIFGLNTTQAILGGSHYVRSLEGMFLLSEAMERLQWKAFFEKHGVEKYVESLKLLRVMKEEVYAKNQSRSKELLNSFLGLSGDLFQDFKEFKWENMAKSKTFLYWDRFIEMVRLAKDLVRADREGDWPLHLQSIEAVLPYFAVFDSTNYLRWCSLYLEDMKKLPETAPDVHNYFMSGRFVVKRSSVPFSAVAADMGLEQTINRSSKTSGGIIGNTKRKEFVTRWNIIHHELMAVNQTFREVTGVQLNNTELTVNHSFSHRQTQENESKIDKMITYILKYENPFEVKQTTELKLHNFLTRAIVRDEIQDSLLSIQETGLILYKKFRQERLVEKTKRLSDTISRNNIKTFASAEEKKESAPKAKKKLGKELGIAQKQLDIAMNRGHDAQEIFTYDLVKTSYLFSDEDGLMNKTAKHELVKELESNITEGDYIAPTQWTDMPVGYIVDVMANVRKLKLSTLNTFEDLCNQFLSMILGICKKASRIDFIFDSYIEGSVKNSERLRRTKKPPVLYSNITLKSKLPRDMDSFWPSAANKVKLEQLMKGWLIDHFTEESTDVCIVVSQIIGDGTSTQTQLIRNGMVCQKPELDSDHEEADIRIIPHALHTVRNNCTRIVILSSDTDVFVVAMYFHQIFVVNGLRELWLRGGVGDRTRFIPLHVIANKVGKLMCDVLPAMHALTGCDMTSKFGTKSAGIKAEPVQYLKDFGRAHSNVEDCMHNAEKYLVQVLHRGNHGIETMDCLRYNMYYHRKTVTIFDLPPTSYATQGHILRAFYVTYIQINCLGDFSLNPQDYGFMMENECLVPMKYQRALPEYLALKCNCVKCATRSCPCRERNVRCCIFCKCQANVHIQSSQCKNPNIG